MSFYVENSFKYNFNSNNYFKLMCIHPYSNYQGITLLYWKLIPEFKKLNAQTSFLTNSQLSCSDIILLFLFPFIFFWKDISEGHGCADQYAHWFLIYRLYHYTYCYNCNTFSIYLTCIYVM